MLFGNGRLKEVKLQNDGVVDGVEFMKKAIEDPAYRNRLLSPSTAKDPGSEAVMDSRSSVVLLVIPVYWMQHWVTPTLCGSTYDDD